MMRLLALLADYWLLVALAAVVLAAVARVGFGRKVSPVWPALAGLLIGGYILFDNIRVLWGLRPWELAGWTALGVVGLFVLAAGYLLLTGFWSRHLAWVLAALLAVTLGGFVGPAQAGGV